VLVDFFEWHLHYFARGFCTKDIPIIVYLGAVVCLVFITYFPFQVCWDSPPITWIKVKLGFNDD